MIDVGNIKKLSFRGFSKRNDLNSLASIVTADETTDSYLTQLGCIWDESIRFLQGQQYISFNKAIKSYEEIPRTRFNRFIPRPTTNLILPIIQALMSILTKNKPNASIASNSSQQRDMDSTKLAENIQDAKWEMDEEQLKHIKAAVIQLTCGTVFRKDFWDLSLGPYSEPLKGPAGDNCVEMRSPFEVQPDYINGEYFKEDYVKSIDWIKEYYDIDKPGYTGHASNVKEGIAVSSLMSQFTRLQTSTSSYLSSSEVSRIKGSAIVTEFYLKPCKKFSKGLMSVHSDGKTLYKSDSPYWERRYEDSWHPYTPGKWMDIYFRWHGLGVVEQLVPLQRRLNAIDSLIILNRMTMANPVWTIPKGCGVPEGYINGAPGLNIFYRPMGANGAKPETVHGKGLPADIFRERERVVEEMHAIAGDNEVMAGLRPTGVDTASALRMLLEQSYSKFSPEIQEWEKFIEKGQTKKLRLLAKKYKEPRPDLMARMKEINKDNLDVHVKAFVGDNFRDNTNVRIEAGSSLPRSIVMEQERYKELGMANLLGPLDPMANPIGNKEFLEKFGMKPIHNELNTDVEKARYVNSVLICLEREEFPPEKYEDIKLLPVEENEETLSIHHKILTDAMKKPNFKGGKFFQQRFQEIIDAVQKMQEEKAAQEAAAQQQQQVGPQGPPLSLQDTGPITPQGDGLAMGVIPNANEGIPPGEALITQ